VRGGATFGDLFVHRRCIEIRRELREAEDPDTVEGLLTQLDELAAMRLSPDGMTEYEAEHGRSSPIIFKARATIGGDYDQSVALAELRADLEEALDAAVWA
jgi:hypothetical protein